MGVIIDEGMIGIKKSLLSVIQCMVSSFYPEIMGDDSRFFGMIHVSKKEYASVVSSVRLELIVNQGFSDIFAKALIDVSCEGLGIEYKHHMLRPKEEVLLDPVDWTMTEREYIIQNLFSDSKAKTIKSITENKSIWV